MSELTGNLLWLVVGAVVILFILFTFFPKRTRKTVNYLLTTWAEFKQVKKGDPVDQIAVPDFETKQLPRVPDPRTSGEKKP
jgi:hypothetical protein